MTGPGAPQAAILDSVVGSGDRVSPRIAPSRSERLGILVRPAILVTVALIVLSATFVRQSGIPKWHTIWAEDGTIFAQCVYDRSLTDCLVEPYAGYLALAPRLASIVVPVGDPVDLGLRLTVVAGLIAALAAVLTARAVADVTSSSLAGLLAGSSLALVQQAGREVSGNLTNVHWVLFTASVVVLLACWLGRRPDLADLALVIVAALSSAFAPLLLAMALGAAALRSPRARTLVVVALAGSVPQAAAILLGSRPAPTGPPLSLDGLVDGFGTVVLREGWFGPHHPLWNRLVPVLVIVLVVMLAGVALRGPRNSRWVEARRLLDVVVPIVLVSTGLAVFVASAVVNGTVNPRYAYAPTTMTVAATAIAGGLLARRKPRVAVRARVSTAVAWLADHAWAIGMAALVGVFAVTFARSFRLVSRASNGPDTRIEIAAARSSCTSGAAAVEVGISPWGGDPPAWSVSIPCRSFPGAAAAGAATSP